MLRLFNSAYRKVRGVYNVNIAIKVRKGKGTLPLEVLFTTSLRISPSPLALASTRSLFTSPLLPSPSPLDLPLDPF